MKKIRKLVKNPKSFFKDALHNKSKTATNALKNNPNLKVNLEKISSKIPIPEYHYSLYEVYKKQGYHGKAEKSLNDAISLKKRPQYYYHLGIRLKQKKQWWQAVEALSSAVKLSKDIKPNWYKDFALCLTQMNRFSEASDAWGVALSKGSKNSTDWFHYGYTLELAGESHKSEEAYQKAIAYDKKHNAKTYGVGIFHEKRGYWDEASKEYAKKVKENPVNGDLHYRLALSHDRCYRWDDAENAYLNAIALKPQNIDWYYRLGLVRERLGRYDEAAQAYAFAAENRKTHTPYWYYRLGYVLEKLGKLQESCESFLMMKNLKLFDEPTLVDAEQAHASLFNNIKEHSINLIENLQDEIARKENFDQDLYFSLGHMLALQGQYKEASEAFIEQRILQSAHGVLEDPYNKDANLKKVINYTEYYERYALEEKTILYESYHGASISCNPYAIFKSLLVDDRFKEYKHIWVINDKSKIPNELKSYTNVIFISRNCDLYMRYLARAKYLINNVTFPEYFIRKEGQKYLNTWHGTPIKSLGKDIKDDFMAHKNVTRNFLQASHLIQPNTYTTEILLDRYDIKDIFHGTVAKTGYPRQDLMLNMSDQQKSTLGKKLNIDPLKKTILYAPTWRGAHGSAVFDTKQLEHDLKALIDLENVNILFRGHHMTEKLIKDLDILSYIVVPNEIDTNELLSVIDVLVTDYSSIAFDYMALNRPILYYAYDLEAYEKERGFYFPLEDLGGEICKKRDELIAALKETIKNSQINGTQQKAQDQFCTYDDGNATTRTIELLFEDNKEKVDIVEKSTKKSLLLYGGPFIPNGITTSFVNLLNHLDTDRYAISITLEPELMKNNKERLEQYSKVKSNISTIPRVGRMLMTLEEKWNIDKFNSQKHLAEKEMYDLYQKVFSREFKRMYGERTFNVIINFEGYKVFWTSLFSNKSEINCKNSIYLHNDMYGEWQLRFPYLEQNFKLYKNYDVLAAVSEKTMEHNISNLLKKFDLSQKKFEYVDNVQNPEDSIKKAKEDVEVLSDEQIFKNTKVFINIARLSPEKDQGKLIKAFQKISSKHPEARLINLGSGPLEHHLKNLVKELRLENKVFLLGQRSNPYPYLKLSDCFILSSNHEGQPMTLFEALILEKPIIATDIVGNRSVLEGRPGHLVDNSEDGLVKGMTNFLEGKYEDDKHFDHEQYNQDALNMFYTKACGVKVYD